MFEYKFDRRNKKIAAFSLFNTLIKTKSSKNLPINIDDYIIIFNNVLNKLNDLIKKNYKIIIFTSCIKYNKLSNIKHILNNTFPFADYFISLEDDIYRLPMCGLYNEFLKMNGVPDEIFYVGNNAGRKNDKYTYDINFAYNCNIKFLTETQFFLEKTENISVKIQKYISKVNSINDIELFTKNTTIIVMQGYPASGKTTFINDYINNYKLKDNYIVLPDHNDNPRMFINKYIESLKENKMIFIDYTNSSKQKRKIYFDFLPKHYDAVGIRITTNRNLSYNSNKERYYNSHTDPNYTKILTDQKLRPKLSENLYNMFDKTYEPMSKEEGFNKIYNYTPNIKLKYLY